jgi:hypothetical protein
LRVLGAKHGCARFLRLVDCCSLSRHCCPELGSGHIRRRRLALRNFADPRPFHRLRFSGLHGIRDPVGNRLRFRRPADRPLRSTSGDGARRDHDGGRYRTDRSGADAFARLWSVHPLRIGQRLPVSNRDHRCDFALVRKASGPRNVFRDARRVRRRHDIDPDPDFRRGENRLSRDPALGGGGIACHRAAARAVRTEEEPRGAWAPSRRGSAGRKGDSDAAPQLQPRSRSVSACRWAFLPIM